MFARFFREAAVMHKLEHTIKDEAKRWLSNDGSITGSGRGLAKRHLAARKSAAKRIRRMRIKDSYLEHHGTDFKDEHFDEKEECNALVQAERLQDSSFFADFPDCTESPEERLAAKSIADYWQSLGGIDFTPDTTDYGAIKVEDVFARRAVERLVYPRSESDGTDDEMDYDTMVDIYYGAIPPYEGPWFDEWGNKLDEEGNQLDEYGNWLEASEEGDEEEAAENLYQSAHRPHLKVEESHEWGGLSDWEEHDQTW